MDPLKDFFDNLKERASNPFLVSFLISWIVFNWPIVIGLLFYSQAELAATEYKSYIGLIHTETDNWRMIWGPLSFAFVYTFVFQFLIQAIKLFNDWIVSFRRNLRAKATNDHRSISVDFHNKKIAKLEEDLSKFANMVSSETTLTEQNKNLQSRIDQMDLELEKWKQKSLKDGEDNFEHIRKLTEQNNLMIEAKEKELSELRQNQAFVSYDFGKLAGVEATNDINISNLKYSFTKAMEVLTNTGIRIGNLSSNLKNAPDEVIRKNEITEALDLISSDTIDHIHFINSELNPDDPSNGA